ncbi:hypothetical protein [Inhella sp.]|uniref:hypothetical protein n=1 Tax=Inhella sp. TaxID=1921806 RepID=UPI0035ADA3C1
MSLPVQPVSVQLPEDEMRIRFEADETIVFASSSGHCNLDCSYCVASPVVKLQPSLDYDDLMFLKERVGGRVFFIFSGRGDFFAGYKKSDRLLARLLENEDVSVALDINGVVIHCFPELTVAQRARVRHVNLTFHYRQLKEHRALEVWRRNALTLLQLHDNPDFFVNFILAPTESEDWNEALHWYREHLFAAFPKRLVLINDVLTPFGAEQEARLRALQQAHADLLYTVRRGNFASLLSAFDHVSCPAGQSYFRVWNDGAVEACPNVAELRHHGNLKHREFWPRTEPFLCGDVRHCDCYHIASSGRMQFFKGGLPPGANRVIPLQPA